MRSKKDIVKAHALRKRVRNEKARLRKRNKKHTSRYAKLVTYHVTLSPETLELLYAKAREYRVSPRTIIKMALKRAAKIYEEEGLNGIQEKLNIKVDEDSEQ